MPNGIDSLLNLPEFVQIIIATGYLGYSVAKAGLRDKERKDELLYGIIVFGLFGYIVYDLLKPQFTHFIIPALSASGSTVIIAALWRKYFKHWFNKLFHAVGVSNEDGTPSVWTGITQATHSGPTQLHVQLKDGSSLTCNDVQSFKDAPFPFYYTDNAGNLAMYVTNATLADGTKKEKPTVRDGKYGDRLTYVPSSEIAKVEIRFKKK